MGRLDIKFRRQMTTCTATLVEVDVILTNHHCVPGTGAYGPVEEATLVMNYYDEGGDAPVSRYRVEPVPISASRDRDFAYLRVDGMPGRKWGVASFDATPPRPGASLLIIHHPASLPKHVTRGNCRAARPHAIAADGVDLIHLCDTLPGSSGAPIFSNGGLIVGIHSRGGTASGGGAKNYGVVVAALNADAGGGAGHLRGGNEALRAAGAGIGAKRVRLDPYDSAGYQFDLVMVENLRWRVRELDGRMGALFTELYRENNSVFLRPDYAPAEVIELILSERNVRVFENGDFRFDWSEIVDVEGFATNQIDFRDLGILRYDHGGGEVGSFVHSNRDEWTEVVGAGPPRAWREIGRTQSEVFLRNQSGDEVTLDRASNKVAVHDRNGGYQAYPILMASRSIR